MLERTFVGPVPRSPAARFTLACARRLVLSLSNGVVRRGEEPAGNDRSALTSDGIYYPPRHAPRSFAGSHAPRNDRGQSALSTTRSAGPAPACAGRSLSKRI